MFNFLSLFKKKEKRMLTSGLSREVIEGFIDKIEDVICIADSNYKIEYINKPDMANKYNYLLDLLEYDNNKSIYNKIIETAKKEGFYSGDLTKCAAVTSLSHNKTYPDIYSHSFSTAITKWLEPEICLK